MQDASFHLAADDGAEDFRADGALSTSVNQCDGCARGLPVDANNLHRGPSAWDVQGCTSDRYESKGEQA